MNSRYLAAGILVLAIVAVGSLQLAQITGFIPSAVGSQEIQVVIDGGSGPLSYSVTLSPRETAFDALKHVATVDYDMYSTGIYITGINGIRQDSGHYWMFFVNDEMPEVGSDFYYPVSGDVVRFRFVSTEEAAGYFE